MRSQERPLVKVQWRPSILVMPGSQDSGRCGMEPTRQAMCAVGGRAGEMELPKSPGVQKIMRKFQFMSKFETLDNELFTLWDFAFVLIQL